ncbi:MAG: chromate transporter [Actinomycetota bacterium]
MHRMLVEERRWIGEERFLHALNFCMLLPGPEAMQLATYIGWRLNDTLGGLAAGLLFVLPGAIVVLGLSIAYAYFGQVPIIQAAFVGIKAAVLVIVVEALVRVGRRALRGPYDAAIAAAAFVAIFFFAVPSRSSSLALPRSAFSSIAQSRQVWSRRNLPSLLCCCRKRF